MKRVKSLINPEALGDSAMTDYTGCDVHSAPFPNNLVPSEQVYDVRVSQPATINKRKGTKLVDLDMCHAEFEELILKRMSALKLKPHWQFQYWGTVTDPDTKEESRRQVTEDLIVQ